MSSGYAWLMNAFKAKMRPPWKRESVITGILPHRNPRHEAQINELRHLFPHFANEELAQARDDLEQYLLHALRVFDRLEAESKMASLTQTDHDHYDSIKVED